MPPPPGRIIRRRPRTSDALDPGTVAAPADNGRTDHAQTDDEADSERGPLRRCVVTRERGPRSSMLRFVVGPGGVIVPDLAARLPGRGIWLSPRRDVLDTARRKGAFARAARAEVTVPPDVVDLVESGLRRRVADLVGFARRAGMAVGGFAKCRAALEAGRCALLLEAADGSVEERRRLLSGMGEIGVATPLDARALGAVFGREHMVHVAIAPGSFAGSIAGEAGRLSLVLGADGPATRSSTKAGA